MMKRYFAVLAAIGGALLGAHHCQADPPVFQGTQGDLSASATFDVVGPNGLKVSLYNNSTHDVMLPTDVLTGVFFDVSQDPVTHLTPSLTTSSALLAPGSVVKQDTTTVVVPGGIVGGEWAYKSQSGGLGQGVTQQYGISSSGLNIFGPPNLFPGPNLAGPVSPAGIEYGITSAGDDPSTHNGGISGQPLIKNGVDFTLVGLPMGFDLSLIKNVRFQYGTATSETHFDGTRLSEAPEPCTLALLGLGAAPLAARRLRRRRSA